MYLDRLSRLRCHRSFILRDLKVTLLENWPINSKSSLGRSGTAELVADTDSLKMILAWTTFALSAAVHLVLLKTEYSIGKSYVWISFSFVAAALFCQFIYRCILYPDFLSPLRRIPTPKVKNFPALAFSRRNVFAFRISRNLIRSCLSSGSILVKRQFRIYGA